MVPRREVYDALVDEVRLVAKLLNYSWFKQLALILLKFQYEPGLEADVLELQQQAQVVKAQAAVVLVVVAELDVSVPVHVLNLLQEIVPEDAVELPAEEL